MNSPWLDVVVRDCILLLSLVLWVSQLCHKPVISLTGQYAAVDELLTGEENMHMMGRLLHLKRADIRRRLDLAISLISIPSILSWTNRRRGSIRWETMAG